MSLPRVALVSGTPLDVGGVEAHLQQILRRAVGRFQFTIVASSSAAFRECCLSVNEDVKFINWQPSSAVDFRAACRLRQVMGANSIDLVHTHDPRGGFLGRITAATIHLPRVHTVHMPAHFVLTGKSRKSTKTVCYSIVESTANLMLTDATLFVSGLIRDQDPLLWLGKNRYFVIQNGIDLTAFLERTNGPLTVPLPLRHEGRLVFLFVGRLTRQKGVDILLESVALLRRTVEAPQFDLWIVGDGPERGNLEQLTMDKGLADSVHFLGVREDIPVLMKRVDAFVLPSRYEGMPYVILEAMAAGLPIIATDVGENGLVLRNAALLVPPMDAPALSGALRTMAQDDQMRSDCGLAASQRVHSYSDVQKCAGIYEIYERLLAGRLAGA